METRNRTATLVVVLLVLSLAVAQGGSNRTRLSDSRRMTLPSYVILDERSEPLLASNGKVGFVSSVTGGSLISFSLKSGRVISSFTVGTTAGLGSLVETPGQRLVALPAVNEPQEGHPATVSIIDATSARRMGLHALLALPSDAHITPATRALLTRDGRFCLIASSFNEPALFSFDVESGRLISRLALLGRPSELALFDDGNRPVVALASDAANSLSMIRVGRGGELSLAASFSPRDAHFDSWNNPAFSGDGRTVYIAAAEGGRLFAIETDTGAQIDSVAISSPLRITVSGARDRELIGVTRIAHSGPARSGGVTIVANQSGRLRTQCEFGPPESIEFSRANNVVLDSTGSTAFVASATGVLFAFSAETGELDAHQTMGSELRRIALNEKARTLTALRSTSSGDELVTVGFDFESDNRAADGAPIITTLEPSTVEQGRRKLLLTVVGQNFTEDSVLLANGLEIASDLVRKGKALQARLPRSLLAKVGNVSLRVRVGEVESDEALLPVVRPNAPVINRISPTEIAGPGADFTLQLIGSGFRTTSTVFLGDRGLKTERVSERKLLAQVTSDMNPEVGKFAVTVKDSTIEDLDSNSIDLEIFGPRILELDTRPDNVIAGAGAFGLKIRGQNFRADAQVKIGEVTLSPGRVRRLNSRLIRARVSAQFVEEAKRLPVVVVNPGGVASEPKELEALPPVISGVAPGELLAGISSAKFSVLGANFRKRARVYIASSDGQSLKLERERVRFRSSSRIVVSLTGELSSLLAQPGALKIQIVNPSNGAGVPSKDFALEVAAPLIESAAIGSVAGQELRERLVINGSRFRPGAVVEFLVEGAAVARKSPLRLREDRALVIVRTKFVRALGSYQVRVVNPGEVPSEAITPTNAPGT